MKVTFKLIGVSALALTVALCGCGKKSESRGSSDAETIVNSAVSEIGRRANASEMAINGRKLIQGIMEANVARQSNFLPPVWPRTKNDGTVSGEDISYQTFSSAAGYFNYLFDMAHYGTSDWDPTIDGDLLGTLGKDAVVGKTIRADGLDWCIAANVYDEMPDFMPILVSANFNPAYLPRKWDGKTDRNKLLPIGPKSGAAKSMFDDKLIVIVRKNGAADVIKGTALTYESLYGGNKFDFSGHERPFCYLTPNGLAE